MDEDRTDGDTKIPKGSVKEAIGKIVGSKTTQAEGAAEKATGKAQKAASDSKGASKT